MVEYGILAVMIAAVCAAIVSALGNLTQTLYSLADKI